MDEQKLKVGKFPAHEKDDDKNVRDAVQRIVDMDATFAGIALVCVHSNLRNVSMEVVTGSKSILALIGGSEMLKAHLSDLWFTHSEIDDETKETT